MFIPPAFGGAVEHLGLPFYPADLSRGTLNPGGGFETTYRKIFSYLIES
jgi:hypothetical protein